MSDSNKHLIHRWLAFADAGFDGDFDEFVHPDYVGHLGPAEPMDRVELQRLERAFAAAFTNVAHEIRDLIGEGDRVVLRVETRAVHAGPFYGIAPTGKHVTFTGIVIYRVANGRIAESWAEIDFASLMRTLRG